GYLRRITNGTTVDHRPDLVVLYRQHLEQLVVREDPLEAPLQTNDHAAADARHDLGAGFEARLLLYRVRAVFEDRPGLVRTASRRRVLPPQVTAFDALPMKVRIEESNQSIKVARERGVVRSLDLECTHRCHDGTVVPAKSAPHRTIRMSVATPPPSRRAVR